MNNNFQEPPDSPIEICLSSNGVHTDFVVPVYTQIKDWHDVLPLNEIVPQVNKPKWVAFGWGNKMFYLETPTWDDLTLENAFSALFCRQNLHFMFSVYNEIVDTDWRACFRISEDQYVRLVIYIEDTFKKTEDGRVIRIDTFSYYGYDGFFESKGKFHLFNTCNTWINNGLKTSGLRTALWPPFGVGIFYHYRNKLCNEG